MVFDPLPVSLDPEMVLVLRGSSHPFPRAEQPAVAYLERQSCEQVFPETCDLFLTLFTLRGCSGSLDLRLSCLYTIHRADPEDRVGCPVGGITCQLSILAGPPHLWDLCSFVVV